MKEFEENYASQLQLAKHLQQEAMLRFREFEEARELYGVEKGIAKRCAQLSTQAYIYARAALIGAEAFRREEKNTSNES